MILQLEREIVRKSKLHFNEEYRKNIVSVPTKGLDEITKDHKESLMDQSEIHLVL